ncbi:MAG TPA: hypothetical protein VFB80_18405 [Pirellulaceae bacterium]|nr:hypothetical protein [Pirellulaceae bacterium]
MGNTSSDTRTVIVIVAVVGLLSCGCMCMPLGLLGLGVGLPAAIQVQKAAQAVAENQPPPSEFAAFPPEFKPVIEPPPVISPPNLTPPSFTPTPVPNIPPLDAPLQFTPPAITPPAITPPPPTPSPRPPRGGAGPGGLVALSEQQRRGIYFSATIHRRMLESIEEQRVKTRERGGNADFLEQMVQSTRERMNEQLDRLCERNKLSRAELDQIIAEGDQQGWGGPRRK